MSWEVSLNSFGPVPNICQVDMIVTEYIHCQRRRPLHFATMAKTTTSNSISRDTRQYVSGHDIPTMSALPLSYRESTYLPAVDKIEWCSRKRNSCV